MRGLRVGITWECLVCRVMTYLTTVCPGNKQYDVCGVCGGNGVSCDWKSLYLSMCGNGICDPFLGENCETCPSDCPYLNSKSYDIRDSSACDFKNFICVDYSYEFQKRRAQEKTKFDPVPVAVGVSIGEFASVWEIIGE